MLGIFCRIQRYDHLLLRQRLHEVTAWKDQVISRCAKLQFCIHRLVRIIDGDAYLTVMFLFKPLDQSGMEHIAPRKQ